MKRKQIKIVSIILIFMSLIQVFINNQIDKKQSDVKQETQYKEKRGIKYKDLSILKNELNCLEKCKIISAENDKRKWKVKIKITGEKEEILNEMINLQKYEITSYCIKKNSNESSVILEMYGI